MVAARLHDYGPHIDHIRSNFLPTSYRLFTICSSMSLEHSAESARPRIRHIPQIYLGISTHLLVPHIGCSFFSGIGTHAVDVVLNLEIEGSPMFDTDV